MPIDRETFDRERHPRFGSANPERMRLAFWEWMVWGGDAKPADAKPADGGGGTLAKYGLMVRNGVLKNSHGPYRARNHFGITLDRDEGPIWNFHRMGMTETELPDGRLVCVGGEHEDYYDPDFYIYNDVVVFGPHGELAIYGYPREVFPPTDFHTATLVGDRIVIIGCLGYPADRRPGHTPVYALDPTTYAVTEIPTTGEMPGWLFTHHATLGADGIITVWGGEVWADGEGRSRRNFNSFALDPRTGVWRQLTDLGYRQFTIRRRDGEWLRAIEERSLRHDEVLPESPGLVEFVGEADWDSREAYYQVAGRLVVVVVDWGPVTVHVPGAMSDAEADRLVESIRLRLEGSVGHPCVAERL